MNCPYHPNMPALRVCQECGGHFCNTCAPLKQGKVVCKTCRGDLNIVKERQKTEEEVSKEIASKGKDRQSERIGNMLKTAVEKANYLSTARLCQKHPEVEAVASCCRCKKNICEKCIAFEDKEDLICQECWQKVPLALRLSRKSKGRW